MGPRPPSPASSSHFAHTHFSPPQPPFSSLLSTSDHDTHLLTQALTRELSSGRCPASSPPPLPPPPPPPYTSASRSSSSFSETLSRCLEGRDFGQNSEVFSVLRTLQHHQLQHHQQKQVAAALSCERLRQDGFLRTERNPAQKGSPLSSNSPISAPKEISPESPFSSNLSANSAMSMPNPIGSQSLLAHLKPSNQDAQDRLFASTNASSLNTSEMSNLYSNSFHFSRTAPIALSSQASTGAGDVKVGKKRSRVSNKAPIAVISADASNFRAMVQQLTGIPSSPSIHPYGSGIPLLKPQPIRHPYSYTYTANLPTLDTSACFLGLKPTMKNPEQDYPFVQRPYQMPPSPLSAMDQTRLQGRNVGSMFQSNLPLYVKQSALGDQSDAINYTLSSSSPSLTVPSFGGYVDSCKPGGNLPSSRETEQFPVGQSLLMEEHLSTKSSYNAVDSWIPFDGALANHATNMELARMA